MNNQITVIQLTDYQGSLFRRFTGKEKDSESGYYYFGARYFMPTLSIWNSVDPMADKYPGVSPYAYCVWNPMRIVDPNGEELFENDDIVIKGKNNSSLTIKTSEADFTLYSNQDFGGAHVIDANSKMLAIGYETGIEATGSAVFQASGSCFVQSVLFFGGDYDGYWYDYIGGEAQMNGSNSVEGSVGAHKNWFLGIYAGGKESFKPSSFEGRYYGASLGFSGDVIEAGISINGSWAKSDNGKWNTLSLGASFSIGPQFDLGTGAIGVYSGGNMGGTKLITPEKATRKRALGDRLFNVATHRPF